MKAGDRIILAEEINGKMIYRVRRVESVSPSPTAEIRLTGRPETFDTSGREKGKPGSKTSIFPSVEFIQSVNRSSFQRDTSKIREVTPNNKKAEDFLKQ